MKAKNGSKSNYSEGKLVHYSNKSCFFISYTTKKISGENIDPKEIDDIVDRRVSNTRGKGQSGFKINTDHSFWLKDKNSPRRIGCVRVGTKKCLVDGINKNVPVFEPYAISYK